MIVTQVDALKNLVNEFYNFARLPKSKLEPGDIAQTIDASLALFTEAHKDVEIVYKGMGADQKAPPFLFDPEQIMRILTNLVDNAIEACLKSKVPKVEVFLSFNSELKILSIRVLDNGPGIPEESRGRIFEPYFTSKEKGTGLGLAIVKRMVEDHNGFIRAFDRPSGGTEFLIEFPVSEGE